MPHNVENFQLNVSQDTKLNIRTVVHNVKTLYNIFNPRRMENQRLADQSPVNSSPQKKPPFSKTRLALQRLQKKKKKQPSRRLHTVDRSRAHVQKQHARAARESITTTLSCTRAIAIHTRYNSDNTIDFSAQNRAINNSSRSEQHRVNNLINAIEMCII